MFSKVFGGRGEVLEKMLFGRRLVIELGGEKVMYREWFLRGGVVLDLNKFGFFW